MSYNSFRDYVLSKQLEAYHTTLKTYNSMIDELAKKFLQECKPYYSNLNKYIQDHQEEFECTPPKELNFTHIEISHCSDKVYVFADGFTCTFNNLAHFTKGLIYNG